MALPAIAMPVWLERPGTGYLGKLFKLCSLVRLSAKLLATLRYDGLRRWEWAAPNDVLRADCVYGAVVCVPPSDFLLFFTIGPPSADQ